jgi:hypothetical protein
MAGGRGKAAFPEGRFFSRFGFFFSSFVVLKIRILNHEKRKEERKNQANADGKVGLLPLS